MLPSIVFATAITICLQIARAANLPVIPTINFNVTSAATLHLSSLHSIIVDQQFQHNTNTNGTTLIPPTLLAFSKTFASDLSSTLNINLTVRTGTSNSVIPHSIFLTLAKDTSVFRDAAGRPTSEGYTLTVSGQGIIIAGASPLGVWWGTRTLLQQAKLGHLMLPVGLGTDSPGWGTRGVMLDAGRHFYPPSFLISICSYLSFFKQNEFHVHLSDNAWNNPDVYKTKEQALQLYAAFRLHSNDSALAGLVRSYRANETYTREDFDHVQQQCASRGVTIIPEIEAPGHALVIAQWKPELGLSDLSLLNITHPETIPTLKTIWQTFLPWFHTKAVHIGADEYDSSLADDYNFYVNTLSSFISNTSAKQTRIWGTSEPSNRTSVNKSVVIQHWQYFEDNPLSLIEAGYQVVNSDDSFYIVNKWSESYPQSLNITRIFTGNPAGGAWAPNVFDVSNVTNNPARDNPAVVGHIAALWNDYGMNATTFSEAWYAWRDGLAALADKQWGGSLTMQQYSEIFQTLHSMVPDQNLDKIVPSKSSVIYKYDFSHVPPFTSVVHDLSGNGYDGTCTPSCRISNGNLVLTKDSEFFSTPLSTKGRNYTLSFSVNVSSVSPIGSTIFSGADSILQHGNGTVRNLMLITSVNQPYALNFTIPTNEWTHLELIGRGNATFLSVDGGKEMEFLTVLGVDGDSLVWKEIAIEAPVARIGGGGFVGSVANVTLLGTA